METLKGIGAIILGLAGTGLLIWFIAALGSKASGLNTGYRGGTLATPDDLDNVYKSVRKKIDKGYRHRQEMDDEISKRTSYINSQIMNLCLPNSRLSENEREKIIAELQQERNKIVKEVVKEYFNK